MVAPTVASSTRRVCQRSASSRYKSFWEVRTLEHTRPDVLIAPVNVVLVIDSERMFAELKGVLPSVTLARLPKSGGVRSCEAHLSF